jgi:oligoribonuclease
MDEKLKKKPIEKLLWIDLEMTGLHPQDDLILEVAAIVTDWDFKEIATYQGVVKADEMTLQERVAANAVFWEANPDSIKGLKEQNSDGKDIEVVEQELLDFINEHIGGKNPALLAGNSIHVDRRFIMTNWPKLENRLHYRMLDVSAWKVVFEGRFGKKFAKPESHRALQDIKGSIAELKYYLQKIKL